MPRRNDFFSWYSRFASSIGTDSPPPLPQHPSAWRPGEQRQSIDGVWAIPETPSQGAADSLEDHEAVGVSQPPLWPPLHARGALGPSPASVPRGGGGAGGFFVPETQQDEPLAGVVVPETQL